MKNEYIIVSVIDDNVYFNNYQEKYTQNNNHIGLIGQSKIPLREICMGKSIRSRTCAV